MIGVLAGHLFGTGKAGSEHARTGCVRRHDQAMFEERLSATSFDHRWWHVAAGWGIEVDDRGDALFAVAPLADFDHCRFDF